MSTFRYKYIENSTAGALTIANFPVTNDGDDVQNKIVKHFLTASDFGGQAGKIDHVDGLILDVIPVSYNVLWFDVQVFGYVTAGGVNKYNSLDNQVVAVTFNDPNYEVEAYDIAFWLAADNTLRVYDKGNANPTAKLVATDLLIARICIGQNQDSRDTMN